MELRLAQLAQKKLLHIYNGCIKRLLVNGVSQNRMECLVPQMYLMQLTLRMFKSQVSGVVDIANNDHGFRFFKDWWAEVTHGAKNGWSFSEMVGPSISN